VLSLLLIAEVFSLLDLEVAEVLVMRKRLELAKNVLFLSLKSESNASNVVQV